MSTFLFQDFSWEKFLILSIICFFGAIVDAISGFRVIIMTVANSLRKSRVPDALPMFGTREYMSLSIL